MFDRATVALQEITTTQARLVASAVLVAATVVVGSLIVPRVVRWTARTVSRRVVRGRASGAADLVADNVPWRVPLRLFVWVLQVVVAVVTGLALLVVWGQTALALAAAAALAFVLPAVARLAVTAALAAGAYVGTGLLDDLVSQFGDQSDQMTQHQEQIVFRIGQLSLFAALGLVALSVWQANLDGLLVGAGFAGIVVGFAARQTLGAFVAGFVLMFSRPFEIGDWIAVDGEEGIVTDITMINTRIRNFDGESVVIPNDRVSNRTVTNRSREGRLRICVEVGVDYAADPEVAEEVALDALRDADAVAAQPPPDAVPTRFGDSAVVLELRAWIDNPNPGRKWRATRAMIHSVKAAFEREGIKIPFPQREVAGREEAGGFRIADGPVDRRHVGPDAETD